MELLFISSKKTVIKIYNAANKIAFSNLEHDSSLQSHEFFAQIKLATDFELASKPVK